MLIRVVVCAARFASRAALTSSYVFIVLPSCVLRAMPDRLQV